MLSPKKLGMTVVIVELSNREGEDIEAAEVVSSATGAADVAADDGADSNAAAAAGVEAAAMSPDKDCGSSDDCKTRVHLPHMLASGTFKSTPHTPI
jgi:hypothetical protein